MAHARRARTPILNKGHTIHTRSSNSNRTVVTQAPSQAAGIQQPAGTRLEGTPLVVTTREDTHLEAILAEDITEGMVLLCELDPEEQEAHQDNYMFIHFE